MSREALSFFTIDRGTASTAVALIAPCGGRFRLLASGVSPRGVDLDALLHDLVHRVEATEPDLVPGAAGWRDWARLESVTRSARRVVCAAASDPVCGDLERALSGAGWEIAGRIVAARMDALDATELCLDPSVGALAVGSAERPLSDDRAAMLRLGAVLSAVLTRRPDLAVLLCGPPDVWGEDPSIAGAARLPAPDPVGLTIDSPLRDALRGVILDPDPYADDPPDPESEAHDRLVPDGRMGLRRAIATLAGLLDRRIEAVDIGHAAGSRILAHPAGVVRHLISAEAALVPASALRDEREIDAIARWSAVRSDPFSLADRLRNLFLAPWRDACGDGARLRLAALRAALVRLDAAWRSDAGGDGPAASGADLLVCSGGSFAAVPPPAAALAVVDAMRRPGSLTLFHDHARLLAPIGTLPDPGDRRRLIADLLDDVLLPIGSAIVAGELRPGSRHATTLRVTSSLQQQELDLVTGALRLVDLPPGVHARVELETREGTLLGVRARRLAIDVTGGLGGLLVDTREIPLRLPDRAERRRAMLEAWEGPVWAASEP